MSFQDFFGNILCISFSIKYKTNSFTTLEDIVFAFLTSFPYLLEIASATLETR